MYVASKRSVRRPGGAGGKTSLRRQARPASQVAARVHPRRKRGTSPGLAPLILVVDDFEDARDLFRQILSGHGYRTVTAADGYEAIRKAIALEPALILMDLAMPGLNGFQTTRRLRIDPRTRKIPIVAVTGHASWTYEELANQAGCDSFLTKPVSAQDLIAEMSRVLKCVEDREEGEGH